MNSSEDTYPSAGTPGGRTSTMRGLDGSGVGRDPRASLQNYNQVMLQHTLRQMAAFTDNCDFAKRRNSGTSGSSGRSNASTVAGVARGGTESSPPRSTPGDRISGDVERV
ncbi:hypothetical protein T310_9847 [Rasamsonia emersonii CBS 393.64]|uniref:Uncharacterized protein n=1 Tax=Rasamsonia emersonii (strain ATCC 16479 / CBS 393.64 / IMI 116815) TaxID=1408163 RepID=A0A0F4YEJ5_RASE3|nr:hypothetical protein T310_9847 [Rasamsonia emersonii CBS 393.64]KKA16580.1 hypothetical protein T310_9847 [Rasamsonia emersonii CBS 393.64]